MEVKRSIKVFLLLSESSLDLLPVKSDMAEVISRQDWTARISEERASRAETKFLLASLRSISVRIFLIGSSVVSSSSLTSWLWQQRQISDITSGLTVAIQLLTSLSKIAEFALLMSRHPLPSRMSCDQKSEQIFLFILLEVSVERHLN